MDVCDLFLSSLNHVIMYMCVLVFVQMAMGLRGTWCRPSHDRGDACIAPQGTLSIICYLIG